jgi:hypothetical protein
VKRVNSEPGSLRPVTSADTDKSSTLYNVSTPDSEHFETPIFTKSQFSIIPPAAPQPCRDGGVQFEEFRDNIVEVPDAHPPVVPPRIIKDPFAISVVPQPHSSKGVVLKGLWGKTKADALLKEASRRLEECRHVIGSENYNMARGLLEM